MKEPHILNSPSKTRRNSTVPLGIEKIAFTAQEAARALGISVKSLTRIEERGLIKSCKVLRRRLFSRRALELFVEENS